MSDLFGILTKEQKEHLSQEQIEMLKDTVEIVNQCPPWMNESERFHIRFFNKGKELSGLNGVIKGNESIYIGKPFDKIIVSVAD